MALDGFVVVVVVCLAVFAVILQKRRDPGVLFIQTYDSTRRDGRDQLDLKPAIRPNIHTTDDTFQHKIISSIDRISVQLFATTNNSTSGSNPNQRQTRHHHIVRVSSR